MKKANAIIGGKMYLNAQPDATHPGSSPSRGGAFKTVTWAVAEEFAQRSAAAAASDATFINPFS